MARAGVARRLATLCATAPAALIIVSGCAPAPHAETEVSFGIVSGDVMTGATDDATVNLVVVAPQNDPVWTELREVSVVNEEDGSAVVSAGKDVGLTAGTARGGIQTGSLSIDIDHDVAAFSLGDVTLTLDGREPIAYDAGTWRLSRIDSKSELLPVNDYPASMTSCTDFSATLEAPSDEEIDVVDVTTDAPGLAIVDVESQRDGDAIRISAELECDGSADFYTFTPHLIVERDGTATEQVLDPVLIGYLDIAPEVVERIAER
ncbi:MAG: hypothetical protein ACTHVH_07405 [Microbacterium gubbeenense]|uniref:Lipoprotein n=1 Tax=Candidatus Microbacterium stercoravium TaxID=2838697 RepID=A0A9D2H464_9MICO|nr:hypothetical protein [Candidatus Microbacterium stercoravium]